MRRAALVAIVLVGVTLVLVAVFLMTATWGSLTVRKEVDPLAVLNVGVLLLIGVALGEYLKGSLARTEAEHRILTQEIAAARSSVTSAFTAFLGFAESPQCAESFDRLKLEFKLLSQAVSGLETLVVPKYSQGKDLLGPFLEFKNACTSAARPTVQEQMLAAAKRALLDQALARLAIAVARHPC